MKQQSVLWCVACVCVSMVWAGCSKAPQQQPDPVVVETPQQGAGSEVALGIDGEPCVGRTPRELAGASFVEEGGAGQGETGKGGGCEVLTFKVVAPEGLKVYRMWDGESAGQFGRWWALTPTAEGADLQAYREAYGICVEWNALTRRVACTLPAQSTFSLATTQSATCDNDITLPKTASLQVFIPNPSDTLVDCEEL